MLVLVDEEPIDAFLERFDNGMTRVFLPFDDEDVVRVFSTAMKDQIRPEPPRVIFSPIRPRRQPLLMVKVPVIVKVDGEFVPPKILTEAFLQIDPETMHERQLMGLKDKEISILGHDVAERAGYSFQDDRSVYGAIACHQAIPTSSARSGSELAGSGVGGGSSKPGTVAVGLQGR
jgi:hypothetical protein